MNQNCELEGSERDTLIALVEKGPLWDGDVPSKRGRDGLLEKGLAVQVIVKGEDGYQAATYEGREVYKQIFGMTETAQKQMAVKPKEPPVCNEVPGITLRD